MRKIPILLITHDRPNLLMKTLSRIIRFTNWNEYDLWILDNNSTVSNRKIIDMYLDTYKFINVYRQDFNQISVIQNEIIKQLRSDLYIKLDDDVLVSENWTKAFMEVYSRHHRNMSIGSVIIPINGFGWVPFIEIMNFREEFYNTFPKVLLKQDCIDTAVWSNEKVCEFIWNKCLDIDRTASEFLIKQKGNYHDYICPHRYSIGAIVFSHDVWEKMGGWKVADSYRKNVKLYNYLNSINHFIAGLRKKTEQKRISQIIKIITGMDTSVLGEEEEAVFRFSQEKGLVIPITSQGIVFHFSFFTCEKYLMQKIFLRLN